MLIYLFLNLASYTFVALFITHYTKYTQLCKYTNNNYVSKFNIYLCQFDFFGRGGVATAQHSYR